MRFRRMRAQLALVSSRPAMTCVPLLRTMPGQNNRTSPHRSWPDREPGRSAAMVGTGACDRPCGLHRDRSGPGLEGHTRYRGSFRPHACHPGRSSQAQCRYPPSATRTQVAGRSRVRVLVENAAHHDGQKKFNIHHLAAFGPKFFGQRAATHVSLAPDTSTHCVESERPEDAERIKNIDVAATARSKTSETAQTARARCIDH